MTLTDDKIIIKARNDLLFQAQEPAIAVVCVIAVCFAVSLFKHVESGILIFWTCTCLLSYLFRFGLCVVYKYSTEAEKQDLRWQTRFFVSSSVSGLIWGSAAFLIFPDSSTSHQLILILLVIFLAAATTVTHSAYKWASILFSTCALVPTSIKVFAVAEGGNVEITGMMLGFWLVMSTSSVYLSKTADRMFALTRANAELVSDLTQKNRELERYTIRLEDTRSELSQANNALQKTIATDSLTGLVNRRYFEEQSKLRWLHSNDESPPTGLLIVKIDYFKEYGDLYGDRKSDNCLLMIAEFLKQAPGINGEGDAIARYSHDEFHILLPDTNADHISKLVQELHQGVERLRLPFVDMPGGHSPWVSVSIGATLEQNYTHTGFDSLMERADEALRKAQRRGGKRVFIIDGKPEERTEQRFA